MATTPRSAWMATAIDPEGGDITWSVSGDDEDLFELTGTGNASGGMRGLAFKAMPDYENPGDADTNNIYEVTVVASDGNNDGMRTVTVKVTNVVELGTVSLTVSDPVVGTEITASLTDSDGVIIESVEWKWERADMAAFGENNDIREVGDETAYTPKLVDIGKFLRVQATYLDRTDSVATETGTVETETGEPAPDPVPTGFKNVKWSVVTTPVLGSLENQAPKFNEGSSTVRHVRENEQAEMDIGAAVSATDSDGDDLAYTMGGADKDSFDIGSTDGQLSTKAGVLLDYEDETSYTVIVTANDNTQKPNDTASITVTILVIDADEKPDIWDKADPTATTEQAVPNYPENSTEPVIDLDATDPEDVTPIIWSMLTDAHGQSEPR